MGNKLGLVVDSWRADDYSNPNAYTNACWTLKA